MKHRISLALASMLIASGLYLAVPGKVSAQSVDQTVITTWSDMRIKASPQYAALKLTDDNRVMSVGKTFDSSTSYAAFVATLPDSGCGYYFVNFRYADTSGEQQSRIGLIIWSPEPVPMKAKTLCASFKDKVIAAAQGAQWQIAASEKDEVSYDSVLKVVTDSRY